MKIDMVMFYQNFEFLIKMVLATVMGVIIGFERKSRNKGAGIRTHAIVSLASALMMIVSKYGFFDIVEYDAARVAAQVVSGIGFLGTGLIFIKNNAVNGLTTAAGIWATAGIGLAMGAGLYAVAIFGTLLIVIIQILMHKDTFLSKDHLTITFEISLEDSFNTMFTDEKVIDFMNELKLEISKVLKRFSLEEVKEYREIIKEYAGTTWEKMKKLRKKSESLFHKKILLYKLVSLENLLNIQYERHFLQNYVCVWNDLYLDNDYDDNGAFSNLFFLNKIDKGIYFADDMVLFSFELVKVAKSFDEFMDNIEKFNLASYSRFFKK